MSTLKKTLAMLLALVIVIAILAGCGTTPAPADPSPAAEAPTEESPAEPAEEAAEPGAKPDGYPSGNTVTFICSSSAGSATDVAARAFVDCFEIEGANIVVENISGGSQTIGTTEAMSRDPDGMTLVMMAPAGMFGQPAMNELAYTIEDVKVLANISPDCIAIVVVKPGSELSDPQAFLDYIQNNEFTYGIPNIGGYAHIGMAYTLMQLDCVENGTAVPYDGSQNVMQGVLNGEIDFALLDDNFIASYVEAGDLAAVAALYDGQSQLVSCPGINEYGITGLGGVVGIKWLAVPADTPDDICQYIRAQTIKALESEEYQNYLITANYGTLDTIYTMEELEQIKLDTFQVYKEVLTAIGLA